jgi:hypothetical protein
VTLQQSAIACALLALLILYVAAQLARVIREARHDKVRRDYASFSARLDHDPRNAFGRFYRNNSRG